MNEPFPDDPEPRAAPEAEICGPARYALFGFGWFNLALGVIGMFLPVMPTTVFFIVALWAFSRSSVKFHRWLFEHPRLGRGLRAWHRHRTIPPVAKAAAVSSMAASFVYVVLFVAQSWELPAGLGLLLGAICAYILTRPSRPALP